jgi:hypothetical protein
MSDPQFKLLMELLDKVLIMAFIIALFWVLNGGCQ